jgi:hypothetical protein
MSARSLRASLREPTARKTTRTVSFGRVEGVTVENIAQGNKNALWFSRDEYSLMRKEAAQIANDTQKKGAFKESSRISTRGLERFLETDSRQTRDPRISVLEHNDLAMYALASNRAVNTARQLAEKDALEAHSIQQESSRRKVSRTKSKDKLFNPDRQLALKDVLETYSIHQECSQSTK